MNPYFKLNVLLFVLLISLSACQKPNRFTIDTSHSDSVVIHRLDKELVALKSTDIQSNIEKLFEQYPDFLPLYFEQILGVPTDDRTLLTKELESFLNDDSFSTVNSDVLATYADISNIENELGKSFEYIKHYFPEIKLPELYFFVSGFNRSVVIAPGLIGVGVDMYLGAEYPKYQEIAYQYMRYNMRPESVAMDIVSAIVFDYFGADFTNDRLLDNILYRGKMMYLLSVLMPNRMAHDIMGYSKFQWEWSRKYESEIWNTMLDNGDLYSSDLMLIRKYVDDAPFTTPVSQESPGRLGVWVGWQIVNAWMKSHPAVTLPELMQMNDYQKMLNESAYRP